MNKLRPYVPVILTLMIIVSYVGLPSKTPQAIDSLRRAGLLNGENPLAPSAAEG